MLIAAPPRVDRPELHEDPATPYEDVRKSMVDLQHLNWIFGTAVVTRQFKRWLREDQGCEPITVLDIATGSGDIPRALVRLARRWKRPIRIVALDRNEHMLRFGAEGSQAYPEIEFCRGDALRLPFAPESFDYVLCSLAFHHFGPQGSVSVLKQMEQIARKGWLVNDLRRARGGWLLAWLAMRTFGRRVMRHDAPLSVLRGYTPQEYRQMVDDAGIKAPVTLRPSFPYRVALARTKGDRP